jgi:hypothetical protein
MKFLRSSPLLALILTCLMIVTVQLDWWISHNQFSFWGQCVNHFGETYSCDLSSWVVRGFLSPFALIVSVNAFFVFLLGILCVKWFVKFIRRWRTG